MHPSLSNIDTRSNDIGIMGCGRIGLSVAVTLSERGHIVRILDLSSNSLDLLPANMIEDGRITPIVGDGTREDDLRKASIQDSDVFIALSGKDSQNALSAQIAKHILQTPIVICRIDDSSKKDMYTQLGLITINAAELVLEAILESTDS